MEVRRVDPADDKALAEWHAVLEASDRDDWPQRSGYTARDVRAFARFAGTSRRFELFTASEPGGAALGVGMMEFPLRDNLHATEITVAVHPARRRRGAGRAIVERMAGVATADGRRTLHNIVDVPTARTTAHPSVSFALRLGFVATMPGHERHLQVPIDPERHAALGAVVAGARHAADYRILTFEAPWPAAREADQCELLRVMSTDEPAGDGERQEEVWDPERLQDNDALRSARGTPKLVAVAEHAASGRLVAATELLLAPDVPEQAWQLETVVHPAHRGQRLGLAVKLANLEFLARRAPEVRVVSTGNAALNGPMIAINDLLGFEVAAEGTFWQKQLLV